MSEKDKNKKAKEVAEAMVANMAANMQDPEKFWAEKERRQQEATDEVLEKRRLRKLKEQQEDGK